MTGVFNLRPTKPKYTETWDVSKVLSFLKTLPPVEDLSLRLLSYKLAILIALTQASRSQSLSLLTLEGFVKEENMYILQYCGLLKQSRKGRINPVVKLRKYTLNKSLCVYKTLEEYIKRTENLRGCEHRLFISFIKPHKAVVSSTLSRWIKTLMQKAGIDTGKFKPHSIRGSSASKAKMSGVSLPEIMKTAGWSSAKTFADFYDRPIEQNTSSAYDTAVLQ